MEQLAELFNAWLGAAERAPLDLSVPAAAELAAAPPVLRVVRGFLGPDVGVDMAVAVRIGPDAVAAADAAEAADCHMARSILVLFTLAPVVFFAMGGSADCGAC
ncbi:hypothetical protein ACU686_26175 [Yinghuangia aomiensis]